MEEQSETIPNRHRIASRIVLTQDVIGLLLLLFCTTIVAGKFGQIFRDLLEGQSLPVLTQVVLSVPQTVAAVLFAGAIVALIYKECRIINNTRNLIINATVLAAIVTLFVVFILAMFIPLTAIITSLKK